MRRLLATLCLSLALVLGACGGSHESDRADVRKTVEGFYGALADKDAKKACDAISEKGKEEISETASRQGKKQSCSQIFSLILAFGENSLSQAKEVEVTDVKLDGDQASATISLSKRKSQIGLVKEDGDWKLSGLDLGATGG
jgi:hypothetical protein